MADRMTRAALADSDWSDTLAAWSRFARGVGGGAGGEIVRGPNVINAALTRQGHAPQYAVRDSRRDSANDFGSESSHSQSPSLQRPQHDDGDDAMLSGATAKNCFTSSDPKHELRTSLQQSLTLHVTDPAKVVARKVAASPDAVESHRQSVPKSWAALIAYCRAYPAFGLEVLELMGIDIDRDRQAYGLFLQLQKQVREGQ